MRMRAAVHFWSADGGLDIGITVVHRQDADVLGEDDVVADLCGADDDVADPMMERLPMVTSPIPLLMVEKSSIMAPSPTRICERA